MNNWLYHLLAWIRHFVPPHYTYPALDVSLSGGQILHMVGSIHMGTPDMAPLPHKLLQHLMQADALIVEADILRSASPFDESAPCPSLSQRLAPEQQQQLWQVCKNLHISRQQIEYLPGWQVALVLQAQQAHQLGLRMEYGIDYQLLQAASAGQKKIIELEGASQQLALLQALPENGMSLLQDTLRHWHANARLLQTMISGWLSASPTPPQTALVTTFNADLNDKLMHQRNQRWYQALHGLKPGRYVLAVGALHLYGEGNLPDLLAKNPIKVAH